MRIMIGAFDDAEWTRVYQQWFDPAAWADVALGLG
jgi:hypothetical protein